MPKSQTRPQNGSAVSVSCRLATALRLSLVTSIAAVSAAIPASTYAQAEASGTITGRVINSATKEYLKNAQVELVGTGRRAITGDQGEFRFTGVPAGAVTISISYPGLDTSEQSVTVEAQKTVSQEFALTSGFYDETIQLEAFTVKSPREGNAKAIVDQKQALNVKTVISADAFGDVSEGNVGEFLKFLPGITVDYVEADVRAVRVRGLHPKYANFTIDGHSVATSSSSSIDNGRLFEFEQVSLATLDTTEVNKSPTADMPAANLSGNINVVSKSAFSQKGRVIRYSANTTFNEYELTLKKTPGWDNKDHYKALPGGLLEFSDTFLDGKLGVVAAYSHSGSYAEQRILIGAQTFDRNPSNNATETPIQNSWNFQHGLKPTFRDSMVVNLDYKASDDLTLSLRTSYNYYDATFHNRNWVINSDTTGIATTSNYDSQGNLTGTLAGVPSRSTHSQTNTVAATPTNTRANATVQGSNFRKYGGTFIITPGMKWQKNNITVNGSFSYSQSRNKYDSGDEGYFSVVNARMNNVSWNYVRDGDTGVKITQTAGGNPESILDFGSYDGNVTVNNETRRAKDQFWSGRVDTEINLDTWSLPTKFKFGGDYRFNVRDIQNFNPSWTVTGLNMADYAESFRPDLGKGTNVTDAQGNSGLPPSADKWKLFELFKQYNMDPFSTTASGPFAASAAGNLRNYLQNQFDIEETVWSGYAMATVELRSDLTALAGVRFEKTETTAKAFDDIGHANTAMALYGTTTGTGIPSGATNSAAYIHTRYGNRIARTRTYDNFFPSMQLRYEPKRNLVVRAAYFSSILRPDFASVVGGVTVTGDAPTPPYNFTIRNTELEPETADNFDLQLEYYFEPVGVVSLGIFRKQIKDIQIQTTDTIDLNNIPQQILDLGGNIANFITANSTVSRRINAGDTTVSGLELNYQQELSFLPGAFKGLGVSSNFTYVEPEDVRIFTLAAAGDGMAKKSANLVLRYKFKNFSSQISANWNDARLISLSGLNINRNGEVTMGSGNNVNREEYIDSRLIFGLNLNYKINRYATVFLNLNNFTNEPQVRYLAREELMSRHAEFGATINVGVKGSF
jgi:iron complex outermembrane receptor protein